MGDKQYEKTLEAAINAGCPNFVEGYEYIFVNQNGERHKKYLRESPTFKELGDYVEKYGTCEMIIPASMY